MKPIFLVAALAAVGFAQTTPPVPLGFTLEHTVPLSQMISSTTPDLPAAVMAAVQSGALEVREQINYTQSQNTASVTIFTAAPGSPSPTPTATLAGSMVLSVVVIAVDKVYSTLKPAPGLLLTGKVIGNAPPTPFGNASGAEAAISVGYTGDTPPAIVNLTMTLAGLATLGSGTAAGTIAFPAVTPPPGTNSGPQIVISPASGTVVAQNTVLLDASKTTDPNGLALTFAWASLNLAASISGANTATPTVELRQGAGDYIFGLTVTNSAGQVATAQVKISYYGR